MESASDASEAKPAWPNGQAKRCDLASACGAARMPERASHVGQAQKNRGMHATGLEGKPLEQPVRENVARFENFYPDEVLNFQDSPE